MRSFAEGVAQKDFEKRLRAWDEKVRKNGGCHKIAAVFMNAWMINCLFVQ